MRINLSSNVFIFPTSSQPRWKSLITCGFRRWKNQRSLEPYRERADTSLPLCQITLWRRCFQKRLPSPSPSLCKRLKPNGQCEKPILISFSRFSRYSSGMCARVGGDWRSHLPRHPRHTTAINLHLIPFYRQHRDVLGNTLSCHRRVNSAPSTASQKKSLAQDVRQRSDILDRTSEGWSFDHVTLHCTN